MATEEAKTKESGSARIYKDKLPRIKNVRRATELYEKRDLSDAELIDEILEEGLSKREKKYSLEK